MPHQAYGSDLSDTEWTLLEPLIPAPLPGGRLAKWTRRELIDAMLYVLQTGCAWSLLPHDFPPSSTVFWYFRQWRRSNLWEDLNTVLRERLREQMGRPSTPSAAISIANPSRRRKKGAEGL